MSQNERIRFIRFNQVFDKAFNQSLLKLQSWDKLSSCFPGYCSHEVGANNLANCQRQVVQFWTELCKREFSEILKEKDVKEKLDKLDDLIEEARIRLREEEMNSDDNKHKINLDELTSKQLLELNLHTQRVKAIDDLDQRLMRLNSINTEISNDIKSLEQDIEAERVELKGIYNKYLGDFINKEKDEVLVQGLSDMLIELQEI